MKTDEEYMKLIEYVEYDGEYGMCDWRKHKKKWNKRMCYLKKGINYWQTEGISYPLKKWWGDDKAYPEWIKVCERCAPTKEKALKILKEMGARGYRAEFARWWGNDFINREEYVEKKERNRNSTLLKHGIIPDFYSDLEIEK